MRWLLVAAVLVVVSVHPADATDLSCVSTTFNALSPNDKVCVSVFEDPQVPGVACHISQARKGGWGQPLGLNEGPSGQGTLPGRRVGSSGSWRYFEGTRPSCCRAIRAPSSPISSLTFPSTM